MKLLRDFEEYRTADKAVLNRCKIELENKFNILIANIKDNLNRLGIINDRYANFHPVVDNKGDEEKQTLKTLNEARRAFNSLLDLASDKGRIMEIEHLAGKMMKWENILGEQDNNQTFPWKDIALSILENPEYVELSYDSCPICSNNRIKIYFCSPGWTWSNLMGRAGFLIICPNCKKQFSFKCIMKN